MSFLNKLVVTGIALGCAAFGAGVAAITAQEQADLASQCRQEAELYAIAEEQLAEYIDGCIQAMGGMPAAASGDAADEEMTTEETDAEELTEEEVDVNPEESDYAGDEGEDAP
ncbi:MAG: hypothetical protein PVJ15_05405 [Gammaproteobacteria bacterium]|jgi:hypothetical protein